MSETWAEEVARLQREIAERQARLQFLVLGDPMKCISFAVRLDYEHFQWCPATLPAPEEGK